MDNLKYDNQHRFGGIIPGSVIEEVNGEYALVKIPTQVFFNMSVTVPDAVLARVKPMEGSTSSMQKT